jgi:hypothetical protein
VPKDPMKADFQVDPEKAKKASENTQGMMTAAASKMLLKFAFSQELVLMEQDCVKQMESNPFVNLQGVTHECPRGISREWFKDCVMLYLFTMFPINAAKQEK